MNLFRFTTPRGSLLVALIALLTLATAFAGQRSTANAATYDISALSDICFTPFASIDVVTGDVINITGTSGEPTPCSPVDLTPWTNLWTVEQFPNGGDPLYRVTITQTGSAAVDFGNGRELTINASPGVPGAPTIDEVVPGDGQATVYFSPPATEGGSPITSYTVTTDPGGATTSGGSSPITVTGLENGSAYTFTVAATNSFGTGPSSAPSEATTPLPAADVSLTISPSPSDRGQTVQLEASVTGDNPTGTVEFVLDGVTIGTVLLDPDGTATMEAGPFEIGTYTFRAIYPGDANHVPSDSGDVLHEVTLAGSTTTLSADFSHILLGESALLTATVQSRSEVTGTVTFVVNGEAVGNAEVENGAATLTTSQFALGANEVTAEYSGDENVDGSLSEPIAVIAHELPVETPTSTPAPSETPEVTPTPAGETPTSTPTTPATPSTTPTAPAESTLSAGAPAGSSTLDLADHNFRVGDVIRISPGGPNEETRTVTGLDPVSLDRPLDFEHRAGAVVLAVGAASPTPTAVQGTTTPGAGNPTPVPPDTGSGATGTNANKTLLVGTAVLCLLFGMSALGFARQRRQRSL